jgi:glycosyltransferase involved in cell wall biosynthesis
VFLSLSVHEGFGVPLVEAMTAGVPIVARNVGAVGQTTGDAALLLEAEDPAYVAAAVHRVLTDDALRRTLVANGARRAAELGGDAVGQQFVDAIAAVVGEP